MTIYLIRHGQTEWNVQGRYLGLTDKPLSPLGEETARRAVPPKADLVFCSPLLRCRQTADIMFPNQPKEIVENLHECDFGIFEGHTSEEMENLAEYRAWVDSRCTAPIPGGETVSGFHNRCCAALEETVRAHENDGTLAFVVHGGVIMSLLYRLNTERHEFYDYKIDNCAVITCQCNLEGGFSLKVTGGSCL